MNEETWQKLENISQQHSQEIRGIYVALNEISDTMKAFAKGLVELKNNQQSLTESIIDLRTNQQSLTESIIELRTNQQSLTESIIELRISQASLIETQRSVMESVERLNNTVQILAREAEEDRAAIREMQAEIQQIWQYLLKQSGNGRSE
jgi:uncharacterized phage infection (PIP) family protein YhgE